MAVPQAASRPRLAAVDTNILLHLAEEHCDANNAVLRLRGAGLTVIVTQTVVQELYRLSEYGNTDRKKQLAKLALAQMLKRWGIQPWTLRPMGNCYQDIAAKVILERGYLPEKERNDAYIFIEAVMVGAVMLLTWDGHLLKAPHDKLHEVMKTFDLHPGHDLQILHPKTLLN